jgi:hypothetical protein
MATRAGHGRSTIKFSVSVMKQYRRGSFTFYHSNTVIVTVFTNKIKKKTTADCQTFKLW